MKANTYVPIIFSYLTLTWLTASVTFAFENNPSFVNRFYNGFRCFKRPEYEIMSIRWIIWGKLNYYLGPALRNTFIHLFKKVRYDNLLIYDCRYHITVYEGYL